MPLNLKEINTPKTCIAKVHLFPTLFRKRTSFGKNRRYADNEKVASSCSFYKNLI